MIYDLSWFTVILTSINEIDFRCNIFNTEKPQNGGGYIRVKKRKDIYAVEGGGTLALFKIMPGQVSQSLWS